MKTKKSLAAAKPSSRLRLTVDPDGDYRKESRKIVDYLLDVCPGDVADEVIVGYLKGLRALAAKPPGSGVASHTPQIEALLQALM